MWKAVGFLVLFALILSCPQISLALASNGLTLWFECMVPALFPFMILSGILIRQNLTARFVSAFYPLLGKLYKISRNGVYCMLLGFLCGFPMGARCVGELYRQRRLSRREAALLLAFSNNIGPVYFISYLLPAVGAAKDGHLPLYLAGMYGIPLLYGLLLSRTGLLLPAETSAETDLPATGQESFLESLDAAMQSAISGIVTLGGYMILCNLFNILPMTLTRLMRLPHETIITGLAGCLLEITGGIRLIGTAMPAAVFCLAHIGGLSCILQTKSMLKGTDLSVKQYLLHKSIQTLLCALYYLFLLRFFL